MALALMALIVSIALGRNGSSTGRTAQETRDSVVHETQTAQAQVVFTSQHTPSPETSSATAPTVTSLPPIAPESTKGPPEDHYWLSYPFSSKDNDRAALFYPYASRADGSYPIHHGVDFVNPMGTSILATAPGTIIVAGDDLREVFGARTDFYGFLIIEELDLRFESKPIYVLYGHLSEIQVQVGQRVEPGDVVGLVGMTGYAEGPHLHLEVRYGENDYGETVNPELWLRPHEGQGTLAGVLLSPDDQPIPEARIILYRGNEPNKPFRTIMSYPDKKVNPDPAWGESFCTGELPAGQWVYQIYHKRQLYSDTFDVQPGVTTWLTIRTAQ